MAESSMINKPHAVVIPYPLQGHTIPAVHLSIKLATKGFTVTFVNTEAVHHKTMISFTGSTTNSDDDDIFVDARKTSGLDIRYEVVSDGLPVHLDRTLNHNQFMYSLLHVFSAHVEDLFVRRLSTASPPVTCLVADTFFVWPATLSKKLRLPYVSFWTEPALVFNIYYHMDLLLKNGHFGDHQENRKDTITYIPGVPQIEPRDLMSYLQDTDTSTVVHQIIFKAFEEAKSADLVLCNTAQELEQRVISALQVEKPFYAIGPIHLTKTNVPTSLWAESDCTQWLQTRPPLSVLYISFGSYAQISKRDLNEIAHGIADSGVSFLWALRHDVVSSDEGEADQPLLPIGFVEETCGRGVVVPWCRQFEVLSQGSVGGFLTHCGWNSVMESVWSGVPMLCFPLLTDQFTNRKLVVDEWRIGVDVGEVGAVTREVVRERIDGLMIMRGKEREEVKVVRRKIESAIGKDGSSQKNFDCFIEDLDCLFQKKKK